MELKENNLPLLSSPFPTVEKQSMIFTSADVITILLCLIVPEMIIRGFPHGKETNQCLSVASEAGPLEYLAPL